MIQWLKQLFWKRCHYCKQKKQYFFYIWETSRYDHTKDYEADELEICTDCMINDKNGEVVNDRYEYDTPPPSSFKDRAEEIKKKYNYRFRTRPMLAEELKSFPDIWKLTFEKLGWKKKHT